MMIDVTTLFCKVDDFCIGYEAEIKKKILENNQIKRDRANNMSISEMMTIIILFHQSGFRNFKIFYTGYVEQYLKSAFPKLLSYTRFVALMPKNLIFLCAYAMANLGANTGISFVDSTSLKVCHNLRIYRNKVFAGIAARGKTSTGWFYGFKLHLVVNDMGEVLGFCVTPGNVDDRVPVPKMVRSLIGKLFGDRGYISRELFLNLLQQGLKLVTTVKSNMKNRLLEFEDRILLRKRYIIETINDQLKNISQIEHSRHRSVLNFMVNLMAGLVAYIHKPKKPSIKSTYKIFTDEMIMC